MNETKELNLNQILLAQRKGQCLIEAQQKLQELVKAVSKTGKKGRLTITLDIKPQTAETVVIDDDVTVKAPKLSKLGSSFFATEEGSLSREDPRQDEFEIVKEATVNQ